MLLFIAVIIIASAIIAYFGSLKIFDIIFLSVSAISTTGLTTIGIQSLNDIQKIIIMLLMFIGRIGPLSVVMLFIPDVPNHKKFKGDKYE